MKTIIILQTILAFCLSITAKAESQPTKISIQVVGQVTTPKRIDVVSDMMIKDFFKAAGANEFATKRRLAILRFNELYDEHQSSFETITRTIEVPAEGRISDLHLKDGDIVCIVTKPVVAR